MKRRDVQTNDVQISQVTCCQWRKAKRHISQIWKKTDVVNGGKQNYIIRKFRKSDVLSARKQNDIILKLQKSDAVKVEESNTT